MKTLQIFLLFVLWFAVDSYPQDVIVSNLEATTAGLPANELKFEGLGITVASEGINNEETLPKTAEQGPQDAHSTSLVNKAQNIDVSSQLGEELVPTNPTNISILSLLSRSVLEQASDDTTNVDTESQGTTLSPPKTSDDSINTTSSSVSSWESTSEGALKTSNVFTEDPITSTNTPVSSLASSSESTSENALETTNIGTESQETWLKPSQSSDNSKSSSSSSVPSEETTSEGTLETTNVGDESQSNISSLANPSEDSNNPESSLARSLEAKNVDIESEDTTLKSSIVSTSITFSSISGSAPAWESTSKGLLKTANEGTESQSTILNVAIPSEDSVNPALSFARSLEEPSEGLLETDSVDTESRGTTLRPQIVSNDLTSTIVSSSTLSPPSLSLARSLEENSEGALEPINIETESQGTTLRPQIVLNDSTSTIVSSSTLNPPSLWKAISEVAPETTEAQVTESPNDSANSTSRSESGSVSSWEVTSEGPTEKPYTVTESPELTKTTGSTLSDIGATASTILQEVASIIPLDSSIEKSKNNEVPVSQTENPIKLKPVDVLKDSITKQEEISVTRSSGQTEESVVTKGIKLDSTTESVESKTAVESETEVNKATEAPELSSTPTSTLRVSADETTSSPSQVPSIQLNPCVNSGNFSNPTNCRAYITCSRNSTELLLEENECPERSVFSPALQRCSRDISPCGETEPICLKAGSIANPNDLSSYFWCVPNVLGGFHKYHIHCTPDEVFAALIGRCMSETPVFGPYLPINALPSDRDVVKAEWKQLKKEIKAKAKEEKIRQKLEAKARAHAEKLAAKKLKKDDDSDDDEDDE